MATLHIRKGNEPLLKTVKPKYKRRNTQLNVGLAISVSINLVLLYFLLRGH